YAATRGDTYHQILLPWTFFGWLNVTPRVGQRLSYYSEAEGKGTRYDDDTREIFNTGAEVTWKASRVYRRAESELLDVNGLRHIIQPSVNYVYVPDPSTRPHELPQFDTQLPTSRLLPIEYPQYNSIDSIDGQQAIRVGLWNKLQTKREDGIDYLVNWNVFGDWHLSRHRNQTEFSDVYSELDFKPRSWLTFNSETRYSIREDQFLEANHMVTIAPNETWSIQLGHLFRKETPDLGIGNDLIRATLFYRFNENWAFRTSHYYEARDGVLEYQYYSVYRDFRSWTGALTLRLRENHLGSEDFTIAFSISLKASPRFGVGDDAVRPQRLIGG
ncbi:MAG TPA: LPS assembly protein LptD, partial [Candidatus Acidoferrum sp.]|nr:LPS assembly protein LptD [Candidatus Acidoferrum sp.]